MANCIQPSPTLIINDETGEFVMTHNIVLVIKMGEGSRVFVRETAGNGFVDSSLSPKQLCRRLYSIYKEPDNNA